VAPLVPVNAAFPPAVPAWGLGQGQGLGQVRQGQGFAPAVAGMGQVEGGQAQGGSMPMEEWDYAQ
jgi:hypothetical protein